MPGAKRVFTWILVLVGSVSAPSVVCGGIDMTVTAGAREAYDDNITFVNEAQKKDGITDVFLTWDARHEGEGGTLGLSATLTHHAFARHSTFNNTSADARVDFQKELGRRDRISIADIFVRAEEPRSFEEAFGRTVGRYSYFKNLLDIRYAKEVAQRLGFNLGYVHELNGFSRGGGGDSYMNKMVCGGEYALNEEVLFFLGYTYAQRDFSAGTDAKLHSLTVGSRYHLTQRLYLEATGGMNFAISYVGRYYSRPLVRCSLVHEVDEKTKAALSWDKEYQANSYAADLFHSRQISLTFARELSDRLRCSLSGFSGDGDYATSGTEDEFRGANIVLDYDISERWKWELSYGYSRSDSNVSVREYTKNVVSAALTAEF